AVAIPVGVFLMLLWTVHALVVAESVIHPALLSCCAVVVLAAPLAGPWIGVHGVVAAIAGCCVLLVAVTIALNNLPASAVRRRVTAGRAPS
ncbi:MAG: low temperature requirement protein A, partial [Nonomuraea sp.]|nr:low temperature requirement protein A [Nonomuraea sp.]